MNFKGFIGPSYKLDSVNVDCQRCVNLYPEIIESGTGKESEVAYYRTTPGLEELMDIGEGPLRLVHVDSPPKSIANPTNRTFVVSGSEVYKCIWNGTAWDVTKIGDLETSSGPVSAASSQIDLGVTVFVDGVHSYLYWKYIDDGLPVENFDLFSVFGYVEVENAIQVIWLDGYFIYIQANSGSFFVSDWNSFNVDPLSFAVSEGDPDKVVAEIANYRDLIMFNERSTEVYVNTGNADFPYDRVQGGFIETGCLASQSVAKIDGYVFWLGRDQFGQGKIYAIQGLSPQRISTHAIEQAIRKYANPQKATAYTYQQDGHSFYVINFAEATWCYDLSTRLWHERAYTNNGQLQRHRAESVVFFPYLNLHFASDYESGQIYKLDPNVLTDDGQCITRMRIAPHISNSLKNVFYNSLQIDMETGVGLNGIVQGHDPKVILQWSDDGGHTWSKEKYASIGKLGNYKTRAIFRRLGMARDLVFKMKITDPVKVNITGAQLELERGAS
ncbi:MAG: hypothetical protein JNL11_17495 [Bdellovibrionaceae bacterium]|nr:hypothetical protein [Pseudobdellovibrionaceae bacterium]